MQDICALAWPGLAMWALGLSDSTSDGGGEEIRCMHQSQKWKAEAGVRRSGNYMRRQNVSWSAGMSVWEQIQFLFVWVLSN